MTLSSTSRPAIRGRVLTRLPATLSASGGLAVNKVDGIWTFSPDWSVLEELTVLPDPETKDLWVLDPATDVYYRLSVQALIDNLPAGPAGTDGAAGSTGAAGPGYAATSVTSNTIASSGSKSFTTQSGLAYSAGARVRAADTSNPSTNYMEGVVSSYSGTALVFTADRAVGSGTLTNWTINLAGDKGADGAGTGDVSGPAASVDSEIALFSSTTGKVIKRASLSGLVKAASGVASAAVAGTDYCSATTGSGVLKGNSGNTTPATAGTDFMKPDTTSNLTAGVTATSFSAGTKSSGTFTPDPTLGNDQHYTNGGAHTLAPPTSVTSMTIECVNASAGAITTSGFNIVDGDTYSSTGTKKHIFYIKKTNSVSHLNVRYVTGT